MGIFDGFGAGVAWGVFYNLFVDIEPVADATLNSRRRPPQQPRPPQPNQTTNYTNNYYNNTFNSSSSSNVNNFNFKIINNYFPPPLRDSGRAIPLPDFPPPQLSTGIDNQAEFKTPVGTSINVGKSLGALRNRSTNLLFNPLSPDKKGIKRTVNYRGLIGQFKQAQQDAKQQRELLDEAVKKGESFSIPPHYSGYLVASEKLAGLRGDGQFILGINSISTLAQLYRSLSSEAFVEPTNNIVTDWEEEDVNDELKEYIINGTAEPKRKPMWQLLGYSEEDFRKKTFEDIIKDFGEVQYKLENNANKNVKEAKDLVSSNKIGDRKIENIEQFVAYLISSIFYRSGFHRFPATLPESLLYDKNKYGEKNEQPNIFIEDALEWQEYLLKNLDGILGQFPLTFTYKKNKQDEGRKVSIPNMAEALTELIGMGINTQNNSEASIAIGMKGLVESAKAGNAAIIASDIARANATFLGYKSKESEKEIPYSFNPEGETLEEALQDSTQKIITLENKDKQVLIDDIKTILISSGIVKAALMQPFRGENSFITGDGIREQRKKDKEKYDEAWDKLIAEYNGTSNSGAGNGVPRKFPKAKLKDRSEKEPPTN